MIGLDLVAVGNRLKALRIERGLKQEYVSYKLGMHRSVCSYIEQGKSLKFTTLLKLCNIYGVTIEEVLPASWYTNQESRSKRLDYDIELELRKASIESKEEILSILRYLNSGELPL